MFGNLDSFSAFPFESFLFQLKNLLRTHEKPLEQLAKRLQEMESTEQKIIKNNVIFGKILKKDKNNTTFYNSLICKDFKISLKRNDNCIILHTEEIVIISEIFKVNSEIYISGCTYKTKNKITLYLCDSCMMSIK